MAARQYRRHDGRPSRAELIAGVNNAERDARLILSHWRGRLEPLLREELLDMHRPLRRLGERLKHSET